MVSINEKTKIGLYAVLGTVPFIVGGIFWVSMIYFKVEAAEKINEKQDQKLDSQMMILVDIRERVIRLDERTRIKKGR